MADAKAQKSTAAVEKSAGDVTVNPKPDELNKPSTSAEDQGDNLDDKDSGSAVSSGAKSRPGKPGKDYDVETDPVITSSEQRDNVRKELEYFGESDTLAALVENYKGDRNI